MFLLSGIYIEEFSSFIENAWAVIIIRESNLSCVQFKLHNSLYSVVPVARTMSHRLAMFFASPYLIQA
jgi:hypothetical protein